MTYSLRGSYIPTKHSTGRRLPRQPRQLSRVRITRPRSCMPKMRPCEPRSPSGRRRCASCPAVMNFGLVRQARVAHGTLREVVIIDGDDNIAPFATLSSAEVEATTKQDSDPRACADAVIHVVRYVFKRGESRTSSPSAPSCARGVGCQSMATCARTGSARC